MGIKIKRIELGAFRAYEENQTFDFINSKGQIANLVVIFAPNGFGKTSLLDAIEWGLTKEIHRFANNEVLKKVTKKETGIILKNRNSSMSNGFVQFTDDQDKPFLINTKVTGRKYRSDYNDGVETESGSDLQKIREGGLAKDNILSHDKIESFLLFSSGEERYKALAKFWDYSNDSENYKTIYMLLNEVKKEVANKNKILKEKSKEIKEIHLPLEEINLCVSKINNFELKEININSINNNISEKEIDEIIIELIKQKSLVKIRESETQKRISNVIFLFESLEKYNESVDIQKKLDVKVNRVQNHIKVFKLRVTLQEQKKIENRQLNFIQKRLEMINKLKESSYGFEQLQGIVQKKETEIDEKNKTILYIKKINNQLSSEVLDLELQWEKTKENYESSLKENDRIIANAELYKNLDQDMKKTKRRIQDLDFVIGARNQRFQSIDSKVQEIEFLMKLNVKELINYEFELDKYKELIDSLTKLESSIESQMKKRANKEEEYRQLVELNNDFNALLKVGKKVIETSESSDCPVCSTPFNNFNILLKRIDENIGNVFQLDLINQEIKEIKSVIESQEHILEETFTILQSNLQNDWNRMLQRRNKEYHKLQRANLDLENVTSKQTKIIESLRQLDSYFNGHYNQFNNNDFENSIQLIRNHFIDKLNFLRKDVDQQEQMLRILKEKINDNKKNIIQHKKGLTDIEGDIQEVQLDSNYRMVMGILEELEIPFHQKDILEKHSSLELDLNKIQDKVLKIEKELENIDIELNKQEKYELYELENMLEKYNEERERYYKFITRYQAEFKEHVSSKIINSEILNNELLRLKGILESKRDLINCMEILNEKLQYSKEVLGNSVKVKEKEELALELKKLTEIQSQLVESLKISQQLIVEKINKAFNLEVINKIYSRIEPHPELKFMEISPAFIEDKLSLEIYAPIGEDRKDNPVLFFSSAQLDILSLSIFFAKAVMEQDPVLNTIFMDDPVHHMDSINILSFIDLLRTFSLELDRQIIITTHNENLFKLIEQKVDSQYCNSKFIQLDSHGKIAIE
ncbi:AAA family ATPase [Bacillus mycoides]|uniref:AAA family ATPase n=1 Tax=Bacillus mycoides TaxID=1405 RepID=UPI003D22CB44